jgi:hypothetical protein
MTSTRVKNEVIEYSLEKEQNNKHIEYLLNLTAQENKKETKMFDLGGGVPRLTPSNLSYNSTDIESKLRGISSKNLECGNFDPSLQSKKLGSSSLFQRLDVQIPPSILHQSQRNGFHNI